MRSWFHRPGGFVPVLAAFVVCLGTNQPSEAAMAGSGKAVETPARRRKPAKRLKPKVERDARSALSRELFPRGEQRNLASLRWTNNGPSSGIELAYRRRLGRAVGVGVAFEYLLPNAGYGAVVNLAQAVEFVFWIPGAFHGLHAASRLFLSQYVFIKDRRHRAVARGADVVVGWSWWLPLDMSIEIAGGVRRGGPFRDSTSVCTRARQCGYLHGAWLPRFEIGLGYVF